MSNPATVSARETILAAVRQALPKPPIDLPEMQSDSHKHPTTGGVGYHGDFTTMEEVEGFPKPDESLVPYFQRHLTAMGGQSFVLQNAGEAAAKIHELFPDAKVVCSATPEIPQARRVQSSDDPHSFHDVDVAIVRSHLGIAEAGAVFLTETDLIVPSLGVLTQHIVILLDGGKIVPTLHEAYGGKLDFSTCAYGLFMAGPSATGDIEGVIIHGAQGARSLTVLIMPEASE